MPTMLEQKREELAAKQKALHDIFEEAGADLDLAKVKSLEGDTHTKAAEIKRRNAELTALGEEIDDLVAVEKSAADLKAALGKPAPESPAAPPVQVKSLGQLFVESATYKQRLGNRGPLSEVPDVDVKVLFQTAAGWAPENLRSPGYVPSVQVLPTLLDVIPTTTTSQAAVVYMAETVMVNAAAERAEGAFNAGEAQLQLAPATANVREIAVWIPVTREQMDDVPYVRSYIDNRLGFMLRQRLNTQVATGNGAGVNLLGLIPAAGLNQNLGADPVLDCLYKGLVQVQTTGGASPNAFALNPLDYQDIRLTRTVDGVYIMGSPTDSGPARIWGLPVIQNAAITQGTGLVGDFANFCELAVKQGVQFEYTDSHAALFIQRTLAVLATIRVAFPIYRAAAFCTLSGI